MDFRAVTECRVCKSTELQEFLPLPALPIGDQFLSEAECAHEPIEQGVMVCPHCSLVTLKNTVAPEVLYENFIYETNLSVGLCEHFNAYASHLTQLLRLQKGDQIVDIGSNDGSLLKAFKDLEMKVLGFEPGKEIAGNANKQGLETINDFFCHSALPQHLQAELITANNVFANIEDLDSVIECVKTIISKTGVFVIETGYQIDMIQNLVLDNIYHEHISYFSVESLNVLFKRHQMEIIDVERIATKGGSIRCFIQLVGAKRTVSRRVIEQIQFEKELGFDTGDAHKLFAQKLTTLKGSVEEWLEDKKGKGTIDAFGASVGTVTLIEYFQLHKYIDRIYDDHHLKHNTHSPYRNIPTLPSSEILNYNPETLLLLPWRYRHLIVNKHSNYVSNGGQFVSLLPGISTYLG